MVRVNGVCNLKAFLNHFKQKCLVVWSDAGRYLMILHDSVIVVLFVKRTDASP